MKMKNMILDYFSFNRAEQRGIIVLLAILVGLLMLIRFWPARSVSPGDQVNRFNLEINAFLTEMKRADQQNRKRYDQGKSNRQVSGWPVYRKPDTLRKRQETAFTVEINGADTLEWQRLKGIGSGYARRIVAYRNKLGGFFEKAQLMEVYGMDAQRYAMIRDHLVVDTSDLRRIDINRVTFKELIAHPYFPYEVTRAVILYRKKANGFKSQEELRNVEGVTDSLFRKIRWYVVVK